MAVFAECLPKQGLLHQELTPTFVLCKPKIVPLKSVTLERMESMQKEAQETIKALEREAYAYDAQTAMMGGPAQAIGHPQNSMIMYE